MWHLWCAPHWWAGHFQILLHWLFPRAPKMVSALLYQWGSYVPRSQRWYSGEARLESERFNFKTLAPSFILQPASQDGKEDGCAEKISAASARGPRKGPLKLLTFLPKVLQQEGLIRCPPHSPRGNDFVVHHATRTLLLSYRFLVNLYTIFFFFLIYTFNINIFQRAIYLEALMCL